MIVENVSLDMSHVSLGQLDEYGLMVLFGNAHSRHLVKGREHTPEDIRDQEGLLLYPAYFMTYLKVPPHRLLRRFCAWKEVAIGCDVKRFGDTMLHSHYAMGHQGEVQPDQDQWSEDLVTMEGTNLIVVDATEEGAARKVSVPKPGAMADLEKLRRPPPALMQSRKIRGSGFNIQGPGKLTNNTPFVYDLLPYRDAVPGHAMIFAMFSRIMNYAEYHLLTSLRPGLAQAVIHHLSLLEREMYYYGNCFAGDRVEVSLRGDMALVDSDFHGEALDIISSAHFNFNIEVINQRNGALLALARVEKLLALPTALQDLTQDVKRMYQHYYGAN